MSTQAFLEPDDEIRGQKFVCLSFLSPEKVLKDKHIYFISKFLEFFTLDYKVRATESFVMEQLRVLQEALGNVHMDLENLQFATKVSGLNKTAVKDLSGAEANTDLSGSGVEAETPPVDVPKALKDLADKLAKTRSDLAQKTAADLDAHVKANMADFRESSIQEAYDRFMVVNRQKLEDEFHKENQFRTTVRGLKVRGVYSTHEQATARAQQLHKKDPNFSVYVAELGQWLPWDPEPDDVEDQTYGNEQLNTLMRSYRENAAKRDEFFEEEKRKRVAEANAAAASAKKATFGEKGKEVEATQIARDIFEGAPDLALQRKLAHDSGC
jgi:hypothetical protein